MNAVTAEEELVELKQQITEAKEPDEFNIESTELINKIIDQIDNKKAYLDPSLTIFKFADNLGTNKTYVSQEINTRFNKNFGNFINDYRVTEARRLMTIPDYYNLTLAAISEKADFNSISVFNRSFKRVTGITPCFI
jgi:AraC-like DNA-binding protein